MKVCFSDFWTPFDQNNNFFIHILRELFENIQIVNPEDADIMFFSSFGNENLLYKNCKKIFFTGENERPNFKKCDYSLTFDLDDHDGKNFRLPLWYLYIDWFDVETYENPNWLIPEDYLYTENEFIKKEKNNFCSIVYGKQIESRINAINNISNSYKKVDVFGKANSKVQLPDGEKYKMDLISNYKFSLCYENSVNPGYHTEKLLHGKVSGNIPIYYGDETVSKDFNEKCFINAVNLSDHELVEVIKEIDSNDKLYKKIFDEPLFVEKVSLKSIKKFFYETLK
jgi:hypothetical protein